MKLFISHGGLLGTQEAVACGVPMLMVPLYADQALNARAMADRGVAEVVTLRDSDKDTWRRKLRALLTDQRCVLNFYHGIRGASGIEEDCYRVT